MDSNISLAYLLLGLFMVKLTGLLTRRVGVGELAGYALGGLVVGLFLKDSITPEFLGILASLSSMFVVFYAGLTSSYREVSSSALETLEISACSMGVSFLVFYVYLTQILHVPSTLSVLVSLLMSNTATEVSSLLTSRLPSRLKSLLVSASFFDDVAILVLTSILYVVYSGGNPTGPIITSIFSMVLVVLILRSKAFKSLMEKFFQNISVDDYLFVTASLIALYAVTTLLTYFTSSGLIIGAYLAGLLLSMGVGIRDPLLRFVPRYLELKNTISDVLDGVFAPLFFLFVGVLFDMKSVDVFLAIILITLASLSKISIYAMYSLRKGYDIKTSLIAGFSMNGRGVLEVTLLTIGRTVGVLPPVFFNTLLLASYMTIVLSIIGSSILLRVVK